MRKLFNILFSRYSLSALIILIEIAALIFLHLRLASYSLLLFILLAILDATVLLAIINKEMNPEYRVTWLAVVLLLPGAGVVLYILFHERVMSPRDRKLAYEVIDEIDALADEPLVLDSLGRQDSLAAGKAMAIINGDPTAEVYGSTDSKYYPSGEEMYRDMLSAINSAERFIFLEYFIIEDGRMWRGIYERLKRKAESGVEVRLMYDDIGCIGKLPPDFYKNLIADGIDARRFAKVTPRVNVSHNNRDHRKILVVDGRVGFTGGINLADEYINENQRLGHWKDGGIRLEGDAVRGLTTLFLTLWDINDGKKSDYSRYFFGEHKTEGSGYYLPFGSGPLPLYPTQVGKRAFLDIINQAGRYVYITTPYLIIDYDLTEALIGAAKRGVDVRIITPYTADKRFVKTMTKSAYPHLLAGGVGIYEYTPGFMHHKTLVSDDKYAIVGTINFDYRSLIHHFEDAVWMYDTPTVMDVRDDFIASIAASHRMTEEESRLTLGEWIVKCGLRLFAPLL